MDRREEARQELIRLERAEPMIDTPSLCFEMSRRYGLDENTVLELLLAIRCGPRASVCEKRPVGRPRKTLTKDEMTRLYDLLCRPASEYGWRSALWTPQRVRKIAGRELALTLQKDAMWANLRRFGLTFPTQLQRCLAGSEVPAAWSTVPEEKRGLLYVVSALYPKDFGLDVPAIALVGFTPSKKTPLACAVKRSYRVIEHRHRVKTDFIEYFLTELLTLHLERHLAVLMTYKSAYRSARLQEFASRRRRLHLFEVSQQAPSRSP